MKAGELGARARLLWAILSLVLPVMFGYTTAYSSPVLAFSSAIHFTMKRSTPGSSAVLRHSPSPWAAVVHWSALIPKVQRPSRRHPIYFFSAPTQPAIPTSSFSKHRALRRYYRVLHAATRPANKIFPSTAHNGVDDSHLSSS